MSCKKTPESPGCSSSLIGQKFFFLAIQKFALRTGSVRVSARPGARLDLTVNFHIKHPIIPTSCPCVSEDVAAFT